MIACVRGRLAEVLETGCVVVTEGGVGYEVFLPAHTLAALPEKNSPVSLYTVTVVREDALELYGFQTWDERQVFRVLTSISKVGSRTAVAVLSTFRPDELRQLVAEDDVLALTRVSGIGKKSAQHIFLELKYKLAGTTAGVSALLKAAPQAGVLTDAVAALANLGYAEEEAARAVKAVLEAENDLDVPGALRAALKYLARSK